MLNISFNLYNRRQLCDSDKIKKQQFNKFVFQHKKNTKKDILFNKATI